jgi:hypothetical protein
VARDVKLQITAHDKTAAAFNSLNKKLGGLNKSIGASVTKIAKIGAAFGAAGIAAGVALTKASMASVDALAKTSDRLGIATEKLAGLQHAASLAGVENKTLEKSLQNLAVGVSDAADGSGVAKDALIELGLSAGVLEKLPLDQQLNVVADAMQGVTTQADKVRIATELFGARGVSVLNMIGEGSDNLKEMAAEAEHLGISISRVDVAKIELANDAVTRAKSVFTGLGNQLATSFSPLIMTVADNFRQAALDNEDFGSIGERVVGALLSGYGKFADAIFFLQLGFAGLKVKMLEMAKVVVDRIDPIFTFIMDKYNKMASVFGMDLVDTGKMSAMSAGLTESIGAAIDNVSAMMSQPLPSEGIQATFDEIVASSRRMAEEIANNSPAKVMFDDVNENGGALLEKLTFFQEQAAAGAKKRKEFEMQSATAQTSHVLGELSNQFSGIASNNKKLFQLNKAFQIAQAIMQTYQGATLAMSSYPPPLSFVMAGAQVAAGLGQVAQIRAQSFEGGGFTGRGARAGGLDGKGGQMHLLHPNETVIDHTKGQAGGITVINNIDATGAGADVDMKIRAAMQQTSQQTILSIQDLMRRRRFG